MDIPELHDLVQKKAKLPCAGAVGQVIHIDEGRVLCFSRHPTNHQSGGEFFPMAHGEYDIVGRSKLKFDKALDAFNQMKRTSLTMKPKVPEPDAPPRVPIEITPPMEPAVPAPETSAVETAIETVAAPAPKRRGRPPKAKAVAQA